MSATVANARRSAIGSELASHRFAPHPNREALSAENDALRIEYLEALDRESQEEAIADRVQAERQRREAEDREARIAKAVKERLAGNAPAGKAP